MLLIKIAKWLKKAAHSGNEEIPEHVHHKNAFDAGYKDGWGNYRSDNPFPSGTDAHFSYEEGYQTGNRIYRMSW